MNKEGLLDMPPKWGRGGAFLFWLKLGFISFGGPAGQIAIMHTYLVEKKKWISESRFLHALNYCMLLPGPEAQQLATYTGWLMHGTWGGIIAGGLFIIPSIFILLALSVLYVTYGTSDIVYAIFSGIKPAVVAIIFLALLKIAEKALKAKIDIAVAILSLVALFVFNIPYPIVIFCALILGFVYVRVSNSANGQQKSRDRDTEEENGYLINSNSSLHSKISFTAFTFKALIFLLLWAAPFAFFYLFTSDFAFWKLLSFFFTQAALVTFGGAYSVLLYVAQYAVQKLHWLTQLQMVDGLALGESTPGPLIMVLAFVGFMGSYHHFGNSVVAGCLGLMVTVFFTFLPSFAFILLGAPVIEKTQENNSIKKALSFVSAAVVGVVANLTIFTARSVLFAGSVSLNQTNWIALVWIIISVIGMKKFNVNMILWILISGIVGCLLLWAGASVR